MIHGAELTPVERTRRSIVEDYLTQYGSPIARELAGDFKDDRQPLANTIVAIPVAAHQDSGLIHDALRQYANQQDNDPFSICLLLNAPDNAAPDSWDNAASQTRRTALHYPNLDIRITSVSYPDPTIGAVRKDLWDAIAYRALEDGAYEQSGHDDIVLNNDIDVDSMSPHYIHHIQHHYEQKDGDKAKAISPLGSTALRHALPFRTHPNTAGGILWADLVQLRRQRAGTSGGFEAGLAVPLATYAQMGGFQAERSLGESFTLVNGRQGQNNVDFIPGSWLHTSPRRYIDRFPEHGFADIWTADSFGATDRCRDTTTHPSDATEDQRNHHIRSSFPGVQQAFEELTNETLYRSNKKFFRHNGQRRDTPEVNERYLSMLGESFMLCTKALRRLIKSDPLADEFALYYNAKAVQLRTSSPYRRHHW